MVDRAPTLPCIIGGLAKAGRPDDASGLGDFKIVPCHCLPHALPVAEEPILPCPPIKPPSWPTLSPDMQNLNGVPSLGLDILAGVWNCNRLCSSVQLKPFAGVSLCGGKSGTEVTGEYGCMWGDLNEPFMASPIRRNINRKYKKEVLPCVTCDGSFIMQQSSFF
jgi:hypothetical protein